MFLLSNQRERCNILSCSCRDGPFTVFWTMTIFVRKSDAQAGWVAFGAEAGFTDKVEKSSFVSVSHFIVF